MEADSTEIEVLGLLSQAERIRGKTRFQKLLYFLQEGERVPLGLNFRMHHYGPYSPDLETYLQRLEVRNLVEVDDTCVDGPVFIDVTDAGRRVGDQATSQDKVTRVLERLETKWPKQLELLATVHYLAGATGYDASQESTARLLQAVKVWKQDRFNAREIQSALGELTELEYLP